MTKRDSGFSVVELVVAIAILGILAGLGASRYQSYVEKARVITAAVDIRNISTQLRGFEITEEALPEELVELGSIPELDPWGSPYEYLLLASLNGNSRARKDGFLVPINSDFDLYSVGPDGRSVASLRADHSRDDVIRANDGAYIGRAESF